VRAGLANNNYSFIQDGRALATYDRLISNAHFLSRVPYDPKLSRAVKPGHTIGPRASKIRPAHPIWRCWPKPVRGRET
jgi:hypothetical protein